MSGKNEKNANNEKSENPAKKVKDAADRVELKKKVGVNLITGVIVCAALFAYESSSEDYSYSVVHMLCDGCFVAAVLLMGIGGLKFCRNGGTFDIMSFGIKSVVDVTYPWLFHHPRENKGEKFVDYKDRKRGERRGAADLLIAGAVFLAATIIFLIVWMITEG